MGPRDSYMRPKTDEPPCTKGRKGKGVKNSLKSHIAYMDSQPYINVITIVVFISEVGEIQLFFYIQIKILKGCVPRYPVRPFD